jgi:alpha-N-arabinofuranosidase
MILTPTYHVFKMYSVHQDAFLLQSRLICEDYEMDGRKIPALSCSASEDKDGSITLTVSNFNPDKEITLPVELVGATFDKILSATVLTAPAYNSYNSFNQPETVKPTILKSVKKTGNSTLQVVLPPRSVVAITVNK